MSPENVEKYSKSFTVEDTMKILLHLRASIGLIHYLNHRGTPDVNQRLTNVVNDMGDQWNHAQAVWNVNPANGNDQTTVGDYWSEWLQDKFPYVVLRMTVWAQSTITTMRGYWGPSTDGRSRTVLEILNSLESQLAGLTIDTSRMN